MTTSHTTTLIIGTIIGGASTFLALALGKVLTVMASSLTLSAVALGVASTLLSVAVGAGLICFGVAYLNKVSNDSSKAVN